MAAIRDVLAYLFSLAPAYMAEDWDNVGLLCGHGEHKVSRILVALDATLPAMQEALDFGAELIVTHHPVNFTGIKKLNDETPTSAALLFAAEHSLACVNMHTNLDCVRGGVNDILAEKLGLSEIELLSPRGKDEQGNDYGYIRCGVVPKTDVDTFAAQVKEKLGCRGLRYIDKGSPVQNVAVGGGACGDEMAEVIAAGCDTFVTADLKYHQFLDASSSGLNLIDAGHFQTENPVCTFLAEKLRVEFPRISVKISEKHDDVIRFLV